MHGPVERVVIDRGEPGNRRPLLRGHTPDGAFPVPPPETLDPQAAEATVAVIQQDRLAQHTGVTLGVHAPGTARTVASDSCARTARRALIERDILGA